MPPKPARTNNKKKKGKNKDRAKPSPGDTNTMSTQDQTQQYELHKKAFDTIIEKYNLKTEEKSTEIAELLTNGTEGVSAGAFAEKFGMDPQEAVVFLEWIKVGITFKKQAIDAAKNSGFGDVAKR